MAPDDCAHAVCNGSEPKSNLGRRRHVTLQQAAMWLFGLAQRTATAKTSVALMEGRKMRNTLESVICLRIVWGLCRCRGVASARVGMIVLELGRCNWRGGGDSVGNLQV